MNDFPRLAVFGHPVEHSLSPQLHRRFSQSTGIELHYEALAVPPGMLAAVLPGFALNQGIGANVTLPHKVDAFALASERTPRAEHAGSVNTLKSLGGDRWLGDNTDGAGFIEDLRQGAGFDLKGKRILVVGSGGASRGVASALCAESPALLVIANRTPSRAEEVVNALNDLSGQCDLQASTLADSNNAGPYDLVVNSTSAGLDGNIPHLPDGLFSGGAIACDLIYGQCAQPFLSWAAKQGASQTRDGFGMFVAQGALSFECWFGVKPDTRDISLSELTGLHANAGAPPPEG